MDHSLHPKLPRQRESVRAQVRGDHSRTRGDSTWTSSSPSAPQPITVTLLFWPMSATFTAWSATASGSADRIVQAHVGGQGMGELGWKGDEFGKRARRVHPERAFSRADVALATSANVTPPARNIRLDDHGTARSAFGFARICDVADCLMTHDQGIFRPIGCP